MTRYIDPDTVHQPAHFEKDLTPKAFRRLGAQVDTFSKRIESCFDQIEAYCSGGLRGSSGEYNAERIGRILVYLPVYWFDYRIALLARAIAALEWLLRKKAMTEDPQTFSPRASRFTDKRREYFR